MNSRIMGSDTRARDAISSASMTARRSNGGERRACRLTRWRGCWAAPIDERPGIAVQPLPRSLDAEGRRPFTMAARQRGRPIGGRGSGNTCACRLSRLNGRAGQERRDARTDPGPDAAGRSRPPVWREAIYPRVDPEDGMREELLWHLPTHRMARKPRRASKRSPRKFGREPRILIRPEAVADRDSSSASRDLVARATCVPPPGHCPSSHQWGLGQSRVISSMERLSRLPVIPKNGIRRSRPTTVGSSRRSIPRPSPPTGR